MKSCELEFVQILVKEDKTDIEKNIDQIYQNIDEKCDKILEKCRQRKAKK
mgnify:CR=1 FL=1